MSNRLITGDLRMLGIMVVFIALAVFLTTYNPSITGFASYNNPHVIISQTIPNQTINSGETFDSINLLYYTFTDKNATWTIIGNKNINTTIISSVVSINYNISWIGTEVLTFIATDENGLNESQNVSFTVNPKPNTPPYFKANIPNQKKDYKENFDEINLTKYIADNETPENLNYSFSGNINISFEIIGSTLQISKPVGWIGKEIINITVTDPEGLSASKLFELESYRANTPPFIIRQIPSQNITNTENFTAINLSKYFSDNETPNNLEFLGHSKHNLISIIIENNIAYLSYSPYWLGNDEINFTARDPDNSEISQIVKFYVRMPPPQPYFSHIPDINITEDDEGFSINLLNYLNNKDGFDHFEASSSANINITISNNILLISNPSRWIGKSIIKVYAFTDTGLNTSTNINITINDVEHPPRIELKTAPLKFSEGDQIKVLINSNSTSSNEILLRISDLDGDNISYSFNKPLNNEGSWQIPYNITNASKNETRVTLSVNITDKQTLVFRFNISITNKFHPPEFTAKIIEIQNDSFKIKINATEPCRPLAIINETTYAISTKDIATILNQGIKLFDKKILNLTPNTLYKITVKCFNQEGEFISKEINARTIGNEYNYGDFSKNLSTNLSAVNLSCISKPVLYKKGIGYIRFLSNCTNLKGIDLNLIKLGKGSLDVGNIDLNYSVNIIFFNMSYSNPIITQEDSILNISMVYQNKTINLTINFSSFEINEGNRFEFESIGGLYSYSEIVFVAKYFYMNKPVTNISCTLNYYLDLSKEINNNTKNNYSQNIAYLTGNLPESFSNYKNNVTSTKKGSDKASFKLKIAKLGVIPFYINCSYHNKNKTKTIKEVISGNFTLAYKKSCGDGFCDMGESCDEDCKIKEKSNCTPNLKCSSWSKCDKGKKMRSCVDLNDCSNKTTIQKENCSTSSSSANTQNDKASNNCNNHKKDSNEEGVDCGGPCKPCQKPKTIESPKEIAIKESDVDESNTFLFVVIIVTTIFFLGAGAVGVIEKDKIMEFLLSEEENINEDLVKYIHNLINQGYKPEHIKKHLIKSGWKEKEAHKHIHIVQKRINKKREDILINYIKPLNLEDDKVIKFLLNLNGFSKEEVKEAIKKVVKSKPLKERHKLSYLHKKYGV